MLASDQLYFSLNEKAFKIVSSQTPSFPFLDPVEVAHDITINFLFFSNSFKNIFDESKGALKPFFASYVRKSFMGILERARRRNFPLVSITSLQEKHKTDWELHDNDVEFKYDLLSKIKEIKTLLKGQKIKEIDLESLFVFVVYSICVSGEFKCSLAAEHFKVPLYRIHSAYKTLKIFLKEYQ